MLEARASSAPRVAQKGTRPGVGALRAARFPYYYSVSSFSVLAATACHPSRAAPGFPWPPSPGAGWRRAWNGASRSGAQVTPNRWPAQPCDRLLCWLLAALALACPAGPVSAASTVAGPVAVNTLWRAQDGPFDVAADVTVQGGATLTIEAGTQITMRLGTSLIVQQGALRMLGTAAAPMIITSG